MPVYNNSIRNGFLPSAIIAMPTNPDEETKIRTAEELRLNFQGMSGAGNIVILWGAGGSGETKPIIESFSGASNVDTYTNLETIVFQKIITSHRLTSPTLAGISGGGTLSGNASEILSSYNLFNKTVIAEYQCSIGED
jgi:hypothetical protein